MATNAGSFMFKVQREVIHLENVSFTNYDLLFSSLPTDQVTSMVYSYFVFPHKNCQKQQNIEYLKIETPRCTNEQNPRREILLETSLPYSAFNGNNSFFFLSCFSFFLLLNFGVVPASREPFLKLSFYGI